MNKFFRTLGYLTFSGFIWWFLFLIVITMPYSLRRYFLGVEIFGLILFIAVLALIWWGMRPKISQDKWNRTVESLGRIALIPIVGILILVALGIRGAALLILEPELWIMILIPIVLAIFIPRFWWRIGWLRVKTLSAILPPVLGLVCFVMTFMIVSNSLAKAMVSNVDEAFYVPSDWGSYGAEEKLHIQTLASLTVADNERKTAVTQTLTRTNLTLPFWSRSCRAASQQICDYTQAAKAYYFDSVGFPTRATPTKAYILMIGVSLLTAVTALGLTLYYASDD